MSSPEFIFYQQLPSTVADVIRRSISQGNIAQAERLLVGKPPSVMAEFTAWKRSPDSFLDVLPAEIRNIVNTQIQNSNWTDLRNLINGLEVAAAIAEFERWAARNNIPSADVNGQQRVTNSPPPPYNNLPLQPSPRFEAVAVNTKITSVCANLKENTNILLLGASGVGKSTFVNSIANYFAFGENYTQAREDMTCTIGMEYTKYDNEKNPFKVVLTPRNNDDAANERRADGGTCTINPRCYSFKYVVEGNEKFIRIIDTPGLLDSYGVINDTENLQRILFQLRNFPDLHAICILMKPMEKRLNIAPIYYINELLSLLHNDVAKKIVYCFTNTLGTNFTPGDSLGVLNEILERINEEHGVEMKLSRDNIFCFDNDGFRYFAAQKLAGFPTTAEEEVAQKNWVESAKETERFLQIVANLSN